MKANARRSRAATTTWTTTPKKRGLLRFLGRFAWKHPIWAIFFSLILSFAARLTYVYFNYTWYVFEAPGKPMKYLAPENAGNLESIEQIPPDRRPPATAERSKEWLEEYKVRAEKVRAQLEVVEGLRGCPLSAQCRGPYSTAMQYAANLFAYAYDIPTISNREEMNKLIPEDLTNTSTPLVKVRKFGDSAWQEDSRGRPIVLFREAAELNHQIMIALSLVIKPVIKGKPIPLHELLVLTSGLRPVSEQEPLSRRDPGAASTYGFAASLHPKGIAFDWSYEFLPAEYLPKVLKLLDILQKAKVIYYVNEIGRYVLHIMLAWPGLAEEDRRYRVRLYSRLERDNPLFAAYRDWRKLPGEEDYFPRNFEHIWVEVEKQYEPLRQAVPAIGQEVVGGFYYMRDQYHYRSLYYPRTLSVQEYEHKQGEPTGHWFWRMVDRLWFEQKAEDPKSYKAFL